MWTGMEAVGVKPITKGRQLGELEFPPSVKKKPSQGDAETDINEIKKSENRECELCVSWHKESDSGHLKRRTKEQKIELSDAPILYKSPGNSFYPHGASFNTTGKLIRYTWISQCDPLHKVTAVVAIQVLQGAVSTSPNRPHYSMNSKIPATLTYGEPISLASI
ncbi:hypothetical protein BDR05DRAFT_949370 [Suillus weaverae]|nr:hypothetical protein BDR05DRAFT_949370 [Suillus weaverae]